MRQLVCESQLTVPGQKSGALKVLGQEFWVRYTDRKDASRNRYVVVECQCGHRMLVRSKDISLQTTLSCGCLRGSIKLAEFVPIGSLGHRWLLSNIWRSMMARCYNSSRHDYRFYGGRGIRVLQPEWHDREKYVDYALRTGHVPGQQSSRINHDDHYYEANCRWMNPEDHVRESVANQLLEREKNKKCRGILRGVLLSMARAALEKIG